MEQLQTPVLQTMDTVFQTNNIFIILLGLGTITGSLFFLRWYAKKNPSLKTGTLINKLIIENRESVFLFGAIMTNFFEAMVSASIHPIGQMPINSFTRFGAHGVVAAVAISCAIYFAQFLKSWLISFKTIVSTPGKFFVRLVLVVTSLFGMVAAPIFNLFIVANGTGEVQNCKWLLMDIIYPDYYMNALYDMAGKVPGYDPYAAMTYIMAASFVMTFFHYLLMVLDAFTTLDRHGDRAFNFDEDIKTLDEKINDRGDKEKKADLLRFKDSVRYLLIRAGYTGTDLEKARSTANSTLDRMLEVNDKVQIGGSLARLTREIKGFDTDTKPGLRAAGKDSEIKAKNEEFKAKISKLFGGKTNGGHGLGMPLKK